MFSKGFYIVGSLVFYHFDWFCCQNLIARLVMMTGPFDYGELLYKAQENNRNASNKEVRCYKTTFSPPKKIERSKVSSDNIKKFLARKEEEERKKREEAQKKKEELLALRSQDKKAQRRVQVMLKSTKSANKSVMEDAIDNVNTADTLNGFKQCDEDDYGYVSQEASAFYNKLLTKYEKMPAEPPKFQPAKKEVKDLNAAKDRVRAALQKEAEEEMLPHKRKRKKHDESETGNKDSKTDDTSDESVKKSDTAIEAKKDTQNKPKKKHLAPPPLKFDQLLQIAEKKQFEPILIDETLLKKEPERLMTKKQKLEFEREQEIRLNKGKRLQTNQTKPNSSDSSTKEETQKNVSKGASSSVAGEAIKKKKVENIKTEKSEHPSNKLEKSGQTIRSEKSDNLNIKSEKANLPKIDKKTSSTVLAAPNKATNAVDSKGVVDRSIKKEINTKSSSVRVESDLKNKKNINSTSLNTSSNSVKTIAKKPRLDSTSPKVEASSEEKKKMSALELQIQQMQEQHELLTKQLKLQQIQMKKLSSQNSESAPKKVLKKPITERKKPPPVSKRRIDSESEEYDSELDDFIDDGPEDGSADYSKYISEIFGYDKSKYANVDEEDDECMESNFAQISKEEFVSAKIGLLEDLEDIRKEQEEKKRLKERKMKQLVEQRKKKK